MLSLPEDWDYTLAGPVSYTHLDVYKRQSIDRAIAAIQRNQPFAPTRNNLYDRLMSGPVNPIFYKFFVKANAFTASSACIGCGQCVKRCPMNNVAIKDGKPVWGRNCTCLLYTSRCV